MDNSETFVSQPASRRSFLKKGVLGARTRQLLAGLLANASVAGQEQGSGSCSKANAIRSLASLPALPSAELNQKLFPGFISEDVQTSGATVHTLHKGSGPPLLLLHIAGPFSQIPEKFGISRSFLTCRSLYLFVFSVLCVACELQATTTAAAI